MSLFKELLKRSLKAGPAMPSLKVPKPSVSLRDTRLHELPRLKLPRLS